MKSLNSLAAKYFRLCVHGIAHPGDHRRIGNADSGFMPLSVECIGQQGTALLYSLAHYGEQNGDLMADPEMTFLMGPQGLVFPLTYRNDYVGLDQVAVELDGTQCRFNAKLQSDLCSFAADWLRNIVEQQDLDPANDSSTSPRALVTKPGFRQYGQ